MLEVAFLATSLQKLRNTHTKSLKKSGWPWIKQQRTWQVANSKTLGLDPCIHYMDLYGVFTCNCH